MPLLLAVLTIAGAAITYAYQRMVDRRNQLVELRRTAYQELLISLQSYLESRSEADRVSFSIARTRAFLVASDAVAMAAGSFVAAALKRDGAAPDGAAVLDRYAAMVIAMRRDCFEKTELSNADIVRISPVVWRKEDSK
jgi:hypothetical protein